jgi:hypothetical protein
MVASADTAAAGVCYARLAYFHSPPDFLALRMFRKKLEWRNDAVPLYKGRPIDGWKEADYIFTLPPVIEGWIVAKWQSDVFEQSWKKACEKMGDEFKQLSSHFKIFMKTNQSGQPRLCFCLTIEMFTLVKSIIKGKTEKQDIEFPGEDDSFVFRVLFLCLVVSYLKDKETVPVSSGVP